MGTATFVNPLRSTARPGRGRQNILAGIDLVLVGVSVTLTLFGVLMVYSAGPLFAAMADKPPESFLFRQTLWAGVGLAAMLVATFFSYRWYPRLIVPIMAVTLIALIVVVLFGQSTLGAVRSLFGASVRPSELAKLSTIIYVSVWLHAKRDVLNKINFGLIPLMTILGFMGGLIFLQPDFSAAFTVIILGVVLFFLADGEWRQLALVLVFAILVGWLTVNFYPTGKQRVMDFLAGLQNPMNASFHVRRSLESIINGGLFGVGIGMGSTKFTGLPVAHTDSIFAVIAEETGLLGCGLLIVAYILILWRGLAIARNAPDQLGRLLAAGVSLWIMIEALINMAVMVSLLPHAGNALPFISYGGSSLVSTLAGVGILLNVGRSAASHPRTEGGNTFGSVVDLRWRDGRRRVPRSGR